MGAAVVVLEPYHRQAEDCGGYSSCCTVVVRVSVKGTAFAQAARIRPWRKRGREQQRKRVVQEVEGQVVRRTIEGY